MTFEEWNDGTFQPYKVSTEINNMEKYIWYDCTFAGKYYSTVTLRDRFDFLFTLGVVMCSEFVFTSSLSCLMDFTYHQEKEPDLYHVLVMRIGFG